VDSVGVRLCGNVWMQSFLLLLRSCLSSYDAVLSNLLLSDVCNRNRNWKVRESSCSGQI
jgi:hypothetical protein